jgi:hypothetical protein
MASADHLDNQDRSSSDTSNSLLLSLEKGLDVVDWSLGALGLALGCVELGTHLSVLARAA